MKVNNWLIKKGNANWLVFDALSVDETEETITNIYGVEAWFRTKKQAIAWAQHN